MKKVSWIDIVTVAVIVAFLPVLIFICHGTLVGIYCIVKYGWIWLLGIIF